MARACAKIAFRAQEFGFVLFYVGNHSNVLEFTPPLTLTAQELREGLDMLDRAFEDVAEGRVPDSALDGYAGWQGSGSSPVGTTSALHTRD